jgi:hypothetical protein
VEQPDQPANDNLVGTGDVVPNQMRRSAKAPKLSADGFLAQWKSRLSSKKDPLPALRAMCRAGISGDIPETAVQEIAFATTTHPGLAERLALHLSFQSRFGKCNSFSRRLLRQFRADFAGSIAFDAAEFVGYRAEHSIEEWVAQNAPRELADLESWMRRGVIAFLEMSEPTVRSTGLFAILKEWSSREKPASKPDVVFAQGLIAGLIGPRLNRSRLQCLRSGIQIFESERRDVLDRERNLQMIIKGNQDTIRSQEQNVATLNSELEASKSESESKGSILAARDSEILTLKEQLTLVDRHWEGVSEQQLAKQGGALRTKVQHELREALLALDREDPNVQMALNRLRRIEGIVKE